MEQENAIYTYNGLLPFAPGAREKFTKLPRKGKGIRRIGYALVL